MPDYYEYVTSKGVIVPDTSTLKADVEQEYKNALGTDLDVSENTPQGRLIATETDARKFIIGLNALMANVINPDESYGIYLDALCNLFGITRTAAYSSRVIATISGAENTVIPANSRAKTTSGEMFYLENSVTIPASGTIQATFLSQETGAIPCATGQLTQIVDTVLGWDTITNSTVATLGAVAESDKALKARRENSLYISGSDSLSSIIANIKTVKNVQSVYGYENDSDLTVSLPNTDIEINPHSICVVVDGGTDSEVAKVILEKKPVGCGYTGINSQSVTVNVPSGMNFNYEVTFNRPSYVPCSVAMTIKNNSNNPNTDIETLIKNAILAYAGNDVEGVDGLGCGADVSPFEIASAVTIQIPNIYVSSVEIKKNTDENFSAEVINIYPNEVATIAVTDITITVE